MANYMMFNGTANRVAEADDVLFSNYQGKRGWVLKQIFSSRQECIEYVYNVFGIDAHNNRYAFQCVLDNIVKEVLAA